jgi:hypothetical protein
MSFVRFDAGPYAWEFPAGSPGRAPGIGFAGIGERA